MSETPSNEDFAIDPYRLDDEWVRQPQTFRRYSEALANVRRDYEEAKNKLSVVRAETDLAVRKKPGDFGLEKVTEGVVKATVETAKKVVMAEAVVVEQRHEVNMLEAAVGALDHRKRALSDLVSLHLADYFSKPVAREGNRDAMEGVTKQKARQSKRRRKNDD